MSGGLSVLYEIHTLGQAQLLSYDPGSALPNAGEGQDANETKRVGSRIHSLHKRRNVSDTTHCMLTSQTRYTHLVRLNFFLMTLIALCLMQVKDKMQTRRSV